MVDIEIAVEVTVKHAVLHVVEVDDIEREDHAIHQDPAQDHAQNQNQGHAQDQNQEQTQCQDQDQAQY